MTAPAATSKQNVLLLADVFPPRVGGSGRWMWELYRRAGGLEVTAVAGACEGSREFDVRSPFPIIRAPLAPKDFGGLWPLGWWRYRRLANLATRLIGEQRVDALHCQRLIPEGWLALRLRRRLGASVLCYVHGEELMIYEDSHELKWMAERVLAQSERIIVNSEHTRRRLLSVWPDCGARVATLHPGVDARDFSPEEPDAEFRARLGWSRRRVVLTVGRLQRRKGHDTLIAALPHVRQAIPDILYAIVGAGGEEPRLRQLAAEHGVEDLVRFHGEVAEDDLLPCYQNCDLFALPNRTHKGDFEGFGIVLLEAQACGKPVIAGDSGGAPETLDPGRTGLVVDCRDPSLLAAALVELLGDLDGLAEKGAAAREWILNNFDWPVLADQAAGLLNLVSLSVTPWPKATASTAAAGGGIG